MKLYLAAICTLALASGAPAATHTVTQIGTTFEIDDIAIDVGDTVEWVWTGGNHTVTSGTDLNDPEIGDLFDTPLTSANPSFSFTFTEVGDFPYFCRPHLDFGMTGVIRVGSGATSTEDSPDHSSWSRVKSLYR